MKARRNYLYLAFIPNKCQVWLHDKRTVLDQPIGKRLGGSVDHLACRSQEVGKNHPGPRIRERQKSRLGFFRQIYSILFAPLPERSFFHLIRKFMPAI